MLHLWLKAYIYKHLEKERVEEELPDEGLAECPGVCPIFHGTTSHTKIIF